MRRFQALLIAAGLAAAPAGAAGGPSDDLRSPPTFEKFEWSMSKGRLGVLVMSLTPELRKHFGAADDRGVLVARVEPGTPAAAAGIAVGDVIVDVRGRSIDDASDVLSALDEVRKGQSVAIQVMRDGKPRSLKATLSDERTPDRKWSGPHWLQELMKPFFAPRQSWFRDFLPPPGTRPTETTSRS